MQDASRSIAQAIAVVSQEAYAPNETDLLAEMIHSVSPRP